VLKEGEVYQLAGPGGTSDACAPIWPLIEGRSRRAVTSGQVGSHGH